MAAGYQNFIVCIGREALNIFLSFVFCILSTYTYIIKVVKDILKSFWKFVWIRVQIEFGADLDPDPHCGFETLIFTSPLVFRDAVCCYCPALRLPHRRLHQHWLHQAAADPSLQLFGFVRKEKNCLVNFRNKWHLMYIIDHFLKCKAIIFILYHYLPIFYNKHFLCPNQNFVSVLESVLKSQ